MATYSFTDVNATIVGPGGAFPLGSGAAPADEGITVEFEEDKNTMVTGADGTVMHSLHANKRGTATVRLLKTSPVNGLLSALYNFQQLSAANWGQNVIVISDVARGDLFSCTAVAFARHAPVTWGKVAGNNEWKFHVGQLNPLFGAGVPDVNV